MKDLKEGDLIRAKSCRAPCATLSACPFCVKGVSRFGLVLDSWIDQDDNQSVIVSFEDTELIIREQNNTPWMNLSSYEKL